MAEPNPSYSSSASTAPSSSSSSSTSTLSPSNVLHNIDLSYLDPSRVDWANLNPLPPIHTLTLSQIIWIIVIAVIVLVLIILSVVALVKLYQTNANDYPVLLASPIRGSDFTPLASTLNEPIYPVIDRVVVNYEGLPMPYQGNELVFLQDSLPLPLLNNQVQFTISFWMRIENFDGQTNGVSASNSSVGMSRYTTLLAMNTSTNTVSSSATGGQFQIQYNSALNELLVTVLVIEPSSKTSGSANASPQIYRIPGMLKLQRWQMITVVLDNRNLDVYHNSHLHRSYLLPNVPYLNNTNAVMNQWKRPDWQLFPGNAPFGGTLSCVRYFNYAFNIHEAYRLHLWDKPSDGEAPEASYLWWWTWSRGNTFTSLYRSIVQDWHVGMDYMTFGIVQ